MKPHLKFAAGVWWCGPSLEPGSFFFWACSAPTVLEAWALWNDCQRWRTAA